MKPPKSNQNKKSHYFALQPLYYQLIAKINATSIRTKIYYFLIGIVGIFIIGFIIFYLPGPTSLITQKPDPILSPTPVPELSQTPYPLPFQTSEFTLGSTIINQIDGMEMVFIPAGDFYIGDKDNNTFQEIFLGDFWIDKYEVSFSQYELCIQSGSCNQLIYTYKKNLRDYPVVLINWNDANTYCQWAGRELPTEVQWEKAARGVDGRIYPWGNEDPHKTLANFSGFLFETQHVKTYSQGISPYGVHNMAGNVSEWVDVGFDNPYNANLSSLPIDEQKYRESQKIFRGGSFLDKAPILQTFYRQSENAERIRSTIGFRCAISTVQTVDINNDTNTPSKTLTQTPTPPQSPTPEFTIGSTFTSQVDGMELVYIPAGSFYVGEINKNYIPKKLFLEEFWIDKYEVSNAQYDLCVKSGSCDLPKNLENFNRKNHPVTYIDWNAAKTYCQWAGRDLPTEAQWEKAARGTDGRNYPWGNEEPDKFYANYSNYIQNPFPIDTFIKGISPYKVVNMAGNVAEWVQDTYSPNYIEPDSNYRIIRGGSFISQPQNLQTYSRQSKYLFYVSGFIGFRCATPIILDVDLNN